MKMKELLVFVDSLKGLVSHQFMVMTIRPHLPNWIIGNSLLSLVSQLSILLPTCKRPIRMLVMSDLLSVGLILIRMVHSLKLSKRFCSLHHTDSLILDDLSSCIIATSISLGPCKFHGQAPPRLSHFTTCRTIGLMGPSISWSIRLELLISQINEYTLAHSWLLTMLELEVWSLLLRD